MSMYNKNAQVARNAVSAATPTSNAAPSAESEASQQIRINGFQQVLEMLKVADAPFRESLLRRIGNTDPRMAKLLRQQLFEE